MANPKRHKTAFRRDTFDDLTEDKRSRASMKSYHDQDDNMDDDLCETQSKRHAESRDLDFEKYRKSTLSIQRKLQQGRLSLRDDSGLKSALVSAKNSRLKKRMNTTIGRPDELSHISHSSKLNMMETPKGVKIWHIA